MRLLRFRNSRSEVGGWLARGYVSGAGARSPAPRGSSGGAMPSRRRHGVGSSMLGWAACVDKRPPMYPCMRWRGVCERLWATGAPSRRADTQAMVAEASSAPHGGHDQQQWLAFGLGRASGELSRARGEQRGQSSSQPKRFEQSSDRGHRGAVRRGAMTPREVDQIGFRRRSGDLRIVGPPRTTTSPSCERLRLGAGGSLRRRVMPEPVGNTRDAALELAAVPLPPGGRAVAETGLSKHV